ncbi:MAG TPA: YbhB/YbcL family Raf kinase inhibitor-like protein [Solirubrobacteraceae bacterium]|nr:YbhB/YbcL family Raf kinase inhibitor-like protein [Solirubrobacteraceae bacterium]
MAATSVGCGSSSGGTASVAQTKSATSTVKASTATNPNAFGEISLTSTAFQNGHPLPATYTCSGANISPPLRWSKLPADAKELVFVALDIRKGGRNKVAWSFAGVKPSDAQIAAGTLPPGAVLGQNQTGKDKWGGVCGAKGERHRVAFLIYALRRKLNLKPGFDPIAIRPRLKAATISTGLTLASYTHP